MPLVWCTRTLNSISFVKYKISYFAILSYFSKVLVIFDYFNCLFLKFDFKSRYYFENQQRSFKWVVEFYLIVKWNPILISIDHNFSHIPIINSNNFEQRFNVHRPKMLPTLTTENSFISLIQRKWVAAPDTDIMMTKFEALKALKSLWMQCNSINPIAIAYWSWTATRS